MGLNAERDPIVQAGVMWCPECGLAAFPVDAARLDAARIIATYPAPCRHVRGRMVVLDAPDLAVSPAGPLFSLFIPGRRCAGRNRKRQPCRSYAAPGSDYCHAHSAAPTGHAG